MYLSIFDFHEFIWSTKSLKAGDGGVLVIDVVTRQN